MSDEARVTSDERPRMKSGHPLWGGSRRITPTRVMRNKNKSEKEIGVNYLPRLDGQNRDVDHADLVRRMASAMRFARNEALNLPESYSRLLDEADAILRAADVIRRAKEGGAE